MIVFHGTRLVILLTLLAPASLLAQDAASRSFGLFSLKADGTELTGLYQSNQFDTISSPSVSPDGFLSFSTWHRKDGDDRTDSVIRRIRYETFQSLQLLGDGAMPSWSPRGRRVAFTRFAPNKGVWVMKSDGTEKVLLDRLGINARWSPDGHGIAYVKTARGMQTIAIYDMVEDRYFELWEESGSPFTVIVGGIAWSPDSRQICLRGRRSKENGEREAGADDSQIVIVTIDDASKQKVCETCPEGRFPSIAWNPDGSRIVFSRSTGDEQPTQLYWFDPGSTDKPQPVPGQDVTRDNSDPCWTLDGKHLIFVSGPVAERDANPNAAPTGKTESTDD